MVTHKKRRKHRARRNLKRLKYEGSYGQGERHGYHNGFYVLPHGRLAVGSQIVVEKNPKGFS